jgi:CRISPR-associated protein Cmr5
MTVPKRQTLDQRRAAHAWDVVASIKKAAKEEKKAKEFGAQIRKLPTRIMASGLGPALAFLEAKTRDKNKEKDKSREPLPDLAKSISGWVAKQRPPDDGVERLVLRIIHGDSQFLRYATAECLAYLQWLVRFAEAEGLMDKS